MKLTEVYQTETGERAMYRRGSSDYHTLKYVEWLENLVGCKEIEWQRRLKDKN